VPGAQHDDHRDDRGVDRGGDGAADALPAELDVTRYVGPSVFPNVARRRLAAVLYVVVAVGCLGAFVVSRNAGVLASAIILAAIAAYHVVTGWELTVDETDALVIASRTVGFPVGHASAQLAWRGLRSRPTWRILLYSADDPPATRGLVELDGVDGHVLGEYTEPNPEDWSAYGLERPDRQDD
jgi:hypothetical protein